MTLAAFWPVLLVFLIPFPIGTDRGRRTIPWITYTLIFINVVVFAAETAFQKAHPGVDLYTAYGFLATRPELKTLLTSMFLHVGPAHLFWNMLFLWIFGPHVEEALGRRAFLALYLGGGLAAGMVHAGSKLWIPALHPTLYEPLIGASGAISAIVAPFAARYHRANIRLLWMPALLLKREEAHLEVSALAGLGLWVVQNIGGALWSVWKPAHGGTAYWAHVGGFAFGLIAAELSSLMRAGRQEYVLEEARSAAKRGGMAEVAAQKYQIYLMHDPRDRAVRAELIRVLAEDDPPGSREEAARLLYAMIRDDLKRRPGEAVACGALARELNLSLPLIPRERLRLGRLAEEAGDRETAIQQFRQLIQEMPSGSDSEMARIRLGTVLLATDPQEAHAVLTEFLARYPHSLWTAQVRALLRQTNV